VFAVVALVWAAVACGCGMIVKVDILKRQLHAAFIVQAY